MFKKYLILICLLLLILSFTANSVFAQNQSEEQSSGSTVKLNNPLTGNTSSVGIPTLLGKIILAVMGVVGSIALVMFIYGGITWMTSAGNAEQVTKGKNIVIWAIIGLIVIFSAYALVKFVIFEGLGAK